MAVLWLQTVPSRVSTVPNWGHCKTMPNTQSPFKHSSQLYQTCLSSPWPAFSHGRLRGQWQGPQHHLWSPYLHMTKSILPGLQPPSPLPALLQPLTKNETERDFPTITVTQTSLVFNVLIQGWYLTFEKLICCFRGLSNQQRIKYGPAVARLGTMEHAT